MPLISSNNKVSKEQIISRTDIISEGPIYGLVDGAASIYLDDDNAVEKGAAGKSLSRTATTFAFTTGSAAVTIAANGQDLSQYASNVGAKYLFIREFESAASSTSARVDSQRVTVTASAAIFSAAMVRDDANPSQAAFIRLVKNGVEYFKGYIETYTSTTVVTCVTMSGSTLNANYADASDYTVFVDGKLLISSFNAGVTQLTLAAVSPITGTYQCDIGASNFSANLSTGSVISSDSKYEQFRFEMRNGYLEQAPISDVYGGTGATSITSSVSHDFNVADTGTSWPDYTLGGESTLTSTELGLSAAVIPQVDEVRLTFAYPGLQQTSSESGKTYVGICAYKIELDFDRGAGFSGVWSNYNLGGAAYFTHTSMQAASFSIEEILDLEKHKPFNSFKIKVSKLTRDDVGVNENGTYEREGDYNISLESSLSTAVSVVRERLTHPYTAYINTRVSTKNFTSPPNTSYLCKGLLVQVPSNYVTRDEAADGVANYNRNVTTGAIEASYQNWDGAFRDTVVYTNNPAWVFYDIIINNRYGLGEWLSTTDIDKYALYRIARYCDELVPDGQEGMEPRFVANLYLAKSTQAYKVLKDMATIFRGMLYWTEGNIFPSIDQAQDPIYNFSKANVIGGSFNYEGTSSKVRPNQFVVGWNNPDNNFNAEALIVEDRQNIVKTGKLIKENAVAFGTTSLGQATRYGRWKLWTAINQKELVSFSTSVNAAFIQPGNIINVLDNDKYAVSYSGRISNTGTLSTTVVPLDRAITLSSNTYELSVLIQEPAVFLSQDTATISGVTYYAGDLIAGTYTEAQGYNLTDDSGEPVDTTWQPHIRVENQTVTTASGFDITSLTVDTAFSAIPQAETIWALREIDTDGLTVQGSSKAYKVLSIAEASKNTYDVVAAEHYNDKYFDIDQDFSYPYVDPLSIQSIESQPVPPVTNIYVTKTGQDRNIIDIGWDAPVNSDGSAYEYVDKYEFIHNIPGFESPAYSPAGSTSTGATTLPRGTYQVGIRTISTYGKKSSTTTVKFVVIIGSEYNPTKNKGLILGATISTPIYITDAGVIKLEDSTFKISTAGAPNTVYTYTTGLDDTYIQDASDMPSQDFDTMEPIEAQYKSSYLFFDASDTTDPWKLVRYQEVAVNAEPLNVEYLYDTGTGNNATSTAFTNQTGTVSVAANSTAVVGTGTAFLTEFEVGKVIKFNATDAAEVLFIESDTSIVIDRTFSSAITAVTPAVNTFDHDSVLDTAIAVVRNNNGTFELTPIELIVNPDLTSKTRIVTFKSSPLLLNFDGNEVLTTTYTNLVLTATASGFKNPEFKITGAGFSNPEISQVAETVYSVPNAGAAGYTITLDKVEDFTATDLDFTVDVREIQDPTSASKAASDDITIAFVKDGAGTQTFYQDEEPSGQGETAGDIWIDTNDGSHMWRYNGVDWDDIQDGDLVQAALDVAEALGEMHIYVQGSAPTTVGKITGDIWLDNTTYNPPIVPYAYSMIYRFSSGAWALAPNDVIGKAHVDALNGQDIGDAAQTTADGKIFSWAQPNIPTSDGIGDFWMDTDDGNKLYRAGAIGANTIAVGQWELYQDADIAAAKAVADQAAIDVAIALAEMHIYVQGSAPTTVGKIIGDVWINNTLAPPYTYSMLSRFNGTSWVLSPTDVIGVAHIDALNAQSAADSAQTTADGKIFSWAQPGIPTSDGIGDFWMDTDDGNKLYRAASAGATTIAAGQWVLYQDADIAVADGKAVAAQATASQAIIDAATAQAGADSKIQSFWQISAPSGQGEADGDIWFDTNDKNTIYTRVSSVWTLAENTDIPQAIADASTAQATADGKVVTFVQTTAPTAEGVGDLWMDTDDNNSMWRWSGSAWIEFTVGLPVVGGTLADISGDLDDIANSATYAKSTATQNTGGTRAVNALDSSYDYTRTISTTKIVIAGTNPTNGVILDTAGLRMYDGGVLNINLPSNGSAATYAGDISTDGQLLATGSTSSGGYNASVVGNTTDAGTYGGFFKSTTSHAAFAYTTSSGSSGIIGQCGGTGGYGVNAIGFGGSTSYALRVFGAVSAKGIHMAGNPEIVGDVNFEDDVDIDLTLNVDGVATHQVSSYTGRLGTSANSSLVIGPTSVPSGQSTLIIREGLAPTASVTQIGIYGHNNGGKTCLGLVTEDITYSVSTWSQAGSIAIAFKGNILYFPYSITA